MALLKSIEHTSGVNITYWRIREIHSYRDIDDDGGIKVDVVIDGYLDEQKRLDGKNALDYKLIQIVTNEGNIINNMNILQLIYGFIKEQPEFIDAVDC